MSASHGKAPVTVIDDNPFAGGQIWRGGDPANPWFRRFAQFGARELNGARVISGDDSLQTLLVERDGNAEQISYTKLILATGARELFLPFPGWTLPGVLGVGGLQALVKAGLPIRGKRIVVAGSGPLLLAVAAYLRKHGGVVPLIAEQASFGQLVKFGLGLVGHPGKIRQAAGLVPRRYLTSCWVEAALGNGQASSVRLRREGEVWEERCDYLANSFGFVPNAELAALLGCEMVDGAVKVDSFQQTSLANVYCAGETAGIGGVDSALVEGQIAGYAATNQLDAALRLAGQRRKAKSFARNLNQAFQPRPELRQLAQPETIICRCEDVPLARISTADTWRAAKLHERCGMGPCQGRICGPAVQFILGWEPSSVRPPIFPTHLKNLLQEKTVK
jgi:NADPH-dependent 2,4-dienoyl-CoA reductase/sulfur reductase-like enzyme